MHLLVLSAFRLDYAAMEAIADLSQCTFWCSVLFDFLRRKSFLLCVL